MYGRRGWLCCVAGLVLVSAAMSSAEENDRRGGRDRRDRRFQPGPAQMPSAGGTILKKGKKALYLLVGGFLTAFDSKSLKVLAKKDLGKEASVVTEAAEQATNDAFGQLDEDGDGRLSVEEMPLPDEIKARIFERMDRDGDGTVSRDEVPQMLVQRMVGASMQAAGMVGAPALEVDEKDGSVYVYHAGWLFRLEARSLEIEAKVKVDIPRPEGGGGPPEARRGGRDDRAPAPDRFRAPDEEEPLF